MVDDFDVLPDGQRVAALTSPESLTAPRAGSLVFTLNFFDEPRRPVPIPVR